jgi:flagellar hook-length control protein FliK
VRASATSRTAPTANLHASQAKANANKADETSPFALLVEATAPKEVAKSKRDTQDSDDKQDDKIVARQNDKQKDQTGTDKTAPSAKPVQTEKAEKSDKTLDKVENDTAAKIDSDTTDSGQVSVVDRQLADQQALPPAPVSQPQLDGTAPPVPDDNDDEQILGAAPAAMPTDDSQIKDTGASTKADAKAAASQKDATLAAADANAAASQKDATLAAVNAKSAASQKDAALAIAADAAVSQKNGAPAVADTKTSQNDGSTPTVARAQPAAGPQADQIEEEDAGAPASIPDAPKADVKPAAPKTDNAKPVKTAATIKTPAPDTDSIAKADIPAADKSGEVKPSPTQAETSSDTSGSKPVQSANFAINGAVAPQAPQPGQTTSPIQHVQVSAQPAPNLPALAVEIAAKSQSGAKQFDIRLDPPELGRVEIRLSIDATGKASAHLSADQPQTLHLLQKDAPILTRALREAGLDVSQDGLNFSLRQQAQDGGAGNSNNRGASRAFSLTATASIDATATTAAYRGIANGRLDIRV